jgi:hypothetical protein
VEVISLIKRHKGFGRRTDISRKSVFNMIDLVIYRTPSSSYAIVGPAVILSTSGIETQQEQCLSATAIIIHSSYVSERLSAQ